MTKIRRIDLLIKWQLVKADLLEAMDQEEELKNIINKKFIGEMK